MKSKNMTRKALLTSILAMLLCISMLVGTTFAWFTDEVVSGNNKIVAGNLDVDLRMWFDAEGENEDGYISIADSEAAIFGDENSLVAQNNPDFLWEPGKTEIVYLTLVNEGNLDLKYNVLLNVTDGGLIGSLEYAIIDGAVHGDLDEFDSWDELKRLAGDQTDNVQAGSAVAARNGAIEVHNENPFALAIHMKEEAGNEYQNKDITVDISVVAGQLASEFDSFGNQYDANAELPVVSYASSAADLEAALAAGGKVIMANDVNITKNTHQNGGELDGNGKTLTVNTSSNYDCAITTTGGTIKNLTITGNPDNTRAMGSGSTGNHQLTDDLIIDNVKIDSVLYGINGSGTGTEKVIVTNSVVYGWHSFSNIALFSFKNCTLGMSNCGDGYIIIYGDTSFTNCTFEGVFDMGARSEAAGSTVTITDCYYDGVRITAENFVEYFFYGPGDEGDFGNLMSGCTIIVDGVTVDNRAYI